jgi:foldase protein PrsA
MPLGGKALALVAAAGLALGACTVGAPANQATGAGQPTAQQTAAAPADVSSTSPVAQAGETPSGGVDAAPAAVGTAAPAQTQPAGPVATPTPRKEPDRTKPAATVNGEPITFDELHRELERQGGAQILDTLIVKKLLEQEAKRRNLSATDAEIDRELERSRLNSPPDVRDDERRFLAAIAEQFGSVDQYKEELRSTVLVRKMLAPRIKVRPQDLQGFYEDTKAEYSTPLRVRLERVIADNEEQADTAARKLRAGASLPGVIAAHGSKRPERASQNGPLPLAGVDQLGPELGAAVSELKKGQVTEPLETDEGAFIVARVADRQGGETPTLAQIRGRVQENYVDQRIGELFPTFINELRSKAKIQNQLQPSPLLQTGEPIPPAEGEDGVPSEEEPPLEEVEPTPAG